MFKVLICEATLAYSAPQIFTRYELNIVATIEMFLDETFKKSFDLYLLHTECLGVRKELYEAGDTTPTIFIDEYYNLKHLQASFLVGDDYMVKPLYLEELKVRVHYHYAKIYNHADGVISYKNFYYHATSQQLFKEKEKIHLSPNELKLVTLLFTHKEQAISKTLMYEELENTSDASLRVYISKLRKIGLDITYQRAINSYTLISS